MTIALKTISTFSMFSLVLVMASCSSQNSKFIEDNKAATSQPTIPANKTVVTNTAVTNVKPDVKSTPKPKAEAPKYVEISGVKFRTGASIPQPSASKWELVNKPNYIRSWIESDKFGTLDLIFGRAEGNAIFENDKWDLSEFFVFHYDPGDQMTNAGFFSGTCFSDRSRPSTNTILNVCAQALQKKGITVDQFLAMKPEELQKFFVETKIPLLLSAHYSKILKSNASSVINALSDNGLGQNELSTSMYLAFIDIANQAGLGSNSSDAGAIQLIKIFKVLRGLNKEELLTILRNGKVIDKDNVFIDSYGQKVDQDALHEDLIRVSLARIVYHATNFSFATFAEDPKSIDLSKFTSTDKWLYQKAGSWTYSALKEDYPTLTEEVKAEMSKKSKITNWKPYSFEAQLKDGKYEVHVFLGNQHQFTMNKKYAPKSNSFDYNSVHVPYGDAQRRLLALPNSNAQLESMIKAAPDMFDRLAKTFGE